MSRIRDIANILSASTDMATDAEVTAAIASHNSATTSVHGISNTASLATQTYADSAVSTHVAAADPHTGYLKESEFFSAGKNKLINGAFDVWQRGTTFSSGLINSFAGDRWKITYDDSGGMLTASRVDISSLNIGFKYAVSIKNTGGSAVNANVRMQQAFETNDTHMMRGKTYTLSFYARKVAGSNARITHMAGWTTTETNTFGSSDEIGVVITSGTLTSSFQRFSQTFTASTNASYNSMKIQIDFQFLNSVNDELQVTGIQLEEGSTVTPFSRACGNIQGELAACQRYYYRNSNPSKSYAAMGTLGVTNTNTNFELFVPVPVTMRIPPTSVEYSNLRVWDYNNSLTVTAATLSESTATMQQVAFTVSGAVAGRVAILQGNNNSAAYLGFSAEL